MILRICNSLIAVLSGMWISGYLAIVLPVILKRMQPGQQNGSFTLWADAGWIFLILTGVLCIAVTFICIKQKRIIFASTVTLLFILTCVFQFIGSQNTYQIVEAHKQRNEVQVGTDRYREIDSQLQLAHKSSERNVGFLLILLVAQIGVHIACLSPNAKSTDELA